MDTSTLSPTAPALPDSLGPAPRDLAGLRLLAARLGSDPDAALPGRKAQAALAWMIDRPDESAVGSITELARATGVNPSTLTRLATRLGYRGFNDFQALFRNAMAQQHRQFYSQQAQRLMQPQDLDRQAPMPPDVLPMHRIAGETIANIQRSLDRLSLPDLQEAARLLAHARRISVYGLRQFSALAAFLCYGLRMIRADVHLLDAQGLGAAEGLAQLRAGDVLLVTSVAPYTRSVAQAAAAAADAGIVVIALTDLPSSPLADAARHAFCIPHQSSFFSNSMGAYLTFCEGLLSHVAQALGPSALDSLKQRESFIATLDIEQP